MKQTELSIFNATPRNIWNFKQNHPELVIKDLIALGFNEKTILTVRMSMLARGINKWLKVRRDLIAYKKQIRNELKVLSATIPQLKATMTIKWVNFDNATNYQVHEYHKAREQYIVARELLKYQQRIRGDLKKLCMTDRWQLWEHKKLQDMNTITASD